MKTLTSKTLVASIVLNVAILVSYSQTPLQIAQQAYLKASNTEAGDGFGYVVAVSGDTVVVGSSREASNATGVNGNQGDNSAESSGAAYVFVRSGGAWTQQAYLKASNTEAGDNFGNVVAISGDTVVIGASQEASNATGVNGNQNDNSAPNSGAAYVFVRNGTNWIQQAYLKAPNTESNDFFGVTVAVSGDTVVVSAVGEASNATGVNGELSDNSAPYSGAAYVFVRSGGAWTQQAYLKASNTEAGDGFGATVAVSDDTVVVGAGGEASTAIGINGNQANNNAPYSGAAYVFVRSGTNWNQQAYLKASNTGADDAFGYSVSASGDTVVVGARYESSNATGVNGNQSNNSATGSGAAYVFVRNGTTWTQQAYLKASNTGTDDFFGYSAALSGNTVVIGAIGEASSAIGVNGNQANNNATYAGAAYVFVRNGTAWSQQAYLKASNTGAGDFFSSSVSVSGDIVVVGAGGEASNAVGVNGIQSNNSASSSGAAYLFDLNSPPAPEIAVEYPAGVNLENDSAVLDFVGGLAGGSSQLTFTIRNTGIADLTGLGITITGPNAGEFTVTANPTAPLAPGSNTTFTVTYSPSPGVGSKMAVLHLASNDSDESPFNITLRAPSFDPHSFAQQAYLKASNTGGSSPVAFGDQFGVVTVSGDTVVVGAPAESSNARGVNGNQSNNNAISSGAAYVFVRSGGTWIQQAYLKASNTDAYDFFGSSVAISDDTIVVGAPSESSSATGVNGNQSNNSLTFAGAAYVFVRNGTNWTQQAYLKPSSRAPNDQAFFGNSVAVSGDTIVVGAKEEDSNTAGVNGDPLNNDANGSGAAYIFVRSGTNWTQQAYLKASNPDGIAAGSNCILFNGGNDVYCGDYFGSSVSVSGDTVVVGAPGEASSTTGVDGDQNDNSALNAGAAYVFVRTGTNWDQQAYLKASNTEVRDTFGGSVSVSGDTVVVGATAESSNATGINGDQNDNSAPYSGAAYVFVRSGGVWTQQAYLKASNTGPNDGFGWSVSVFGDIVVVGASGEASNATGVNADGSDNSTSQAGAAYVFVRSGTNWTQQAYLKASNTGGAPAGDTCCGDYFGGWVAVSGDTIVVGAYGEDSNATGVNGNQNDNSADLAGAAYVFSFLSRIALVPDSSSGYFIRFDGLPGRTYRLQRAPSVTGPWPNIATNTAPVSGLIEFHDTNPLPGAAFYRTVTP